LLSAQLSETEIFRIYCLVGLIPDSAVLEKFFSVCVFWDFLSQFFSSLFINLMNDDFIANMVQ